jgi:nitrile hydratase accessory protein
LWPSFETVARKRALSPQDDGGVLVSQHKLPIQVRPLTDNSTHQATRAAAEAVPGIPRDEGAPVFREPWEAQAFAMAVALNQRGLFTWGEWAAVLGEEIKRAQAAGDPDLGTTYYRHWLAALERIVAQKGLADAAVLARTRDAWDHAADRTPHGSPIELREEDFQR